MFDKLRKAFKKAEVTTSALDIATAEKQKESRVVQCLRVDNAILLTRLRKLHAICSDLGVEWQSMPDPHGILDSKLTWGTSDNTDERSLRLRLRSVRIGSHHRPEADKQETLDSLREYMYADVYGDVLKNVERVYDQITMINPNNPTAVSAIQRDIIDLVKILRQQCTGESK